MTLLQQAKIFLQLNRDEPHEDDAIIELFIENARAKVLNYCNRSDLPTLLEFIVLDIALENYKSHKQSQSGEQGAVVNVKRGDTQITYANTENYNLLTGAGGADFAKNHVKQMNTFRKMKV